MNITRLNILHLQLFLAVSVLLSISEAANRKCERGSSFVQLERGRESDYIVSYPIDTCIATKTLSFSLSVNVAGGVVYEAAYGTSDCSGVPIFVGHHVLLQPAPADYVTVEHTSIFAEYWATITVTPNPITINHAAISGEGVLRSIFLDEGKCETGSNAQKVSFSRHNACVYDAFDGLYNQVVDTGCSDATGE
jgi:hypothetical protein